MKLKFGNVEENVVTREEFPLEKAREVLKDGVRRIESSTFHKHTS